MTRQERLTAESEGLRLHPYRCPAGFWTVGYGRNLQGKGLDAREKESLGFPKHASGPQVIEYLKDRGITQAEALALLRHDLQDAEAELDTRWPWMKELDEVRRAAFVDLCFNMGGFRLSEFTYTLGAASRHDWPATAEHLKDSRWFKQVGRRGPRIVGMIASGEWPEEILAAESKISVDTADTARSVRG